MAFEYIYNVKRRNGSLWTPLTLSFGLRTVHFAVDRFLGDYPWRNHGKSSKGVNGWHERNGWLHWCSNRCRLHPPGKIRGSYLDLSIKNHQKFTASKLASDSTKPLWFDATWCYYLQYEVQHNSTIWGHNLRKSLEPKNKIWRNPSLINFVNLQMGCLKNVGSPWRFQSNLSLQKADVAFRCWVLGAFGIRGVQTSAG